MVEVVYCMRRKPGLSQAEFLAHWENVHVPIVMSNLHLLRLHGYERVLPLHHAFSERVERRGRMQPPYDGIAKLTWACDEDMAFSFESPEALAVQRLLAQDEAHFVDSAASSRWISQTVRYVQDGRAN